MTDKNFNRLIELSFVGGGFVPANQNAEELMSGLKKGEIIAFNEVTARDIRFHRCYMALLAFIWGYMPNSFKKMVPLPEFYQWLKHLKGNYEVKYVFADGSQMIEYESIAFGKMSERRFHDYIKEQLPWIYEAVLGKYFEGEMLKNITDTIEDEFAKFFVKL